MTFPDPERIGGLDWARRTRGELSSRERRRLTAEIVRGQGAYLAGRIKLFAGLGAAGRARRTVQSPPPLRADHARQAEPAAAPLNQRARRLEPKCSFSATSASDGALKVPVFSGPDRKSMSTLPTRPCPNSM